MGKKVDFQKASEPTDIIWENRHVTNKIIIKRKIFVFIVIFIMLNISFGSIYYSANIVNNFKRRYPPGDCKQKDA